MNEDSAPGAAAGAVCAKALLMKNMMSAFGYSDTAEGETRRAIITAPLSYAAPAILRELNTELTEPLLRNRSARLLHQIKVVIEIVNRVQPCSENLVDPLQMMQLRAGESSTRRAAAGFVGWCGIRAIAAVA